MIIDEIIAVLFSLVELLLVGLSSLFVGIINLFALLIEFVVLLFISDFSLGRVNKYQRKNKNEKTSEYNHERKNKNRESYITLFAIFLVIAFVGFNSYKTRRITFVAEDGHSLPFASVVVYSGNDVLHQRTRNDGSLEISRFSIDKIILNDKRYKTKEWESSEIDDILIVKRSILGRGVDKLANKFLEKIKGG